MGLRGAVAGGGPRPRGRRPSGMADRATRQAVRAWHDAATHRSLKGPAARTRSKRPQAKQQRPDHFRVEVGRCRCVTPAFARCLGKQVLRGSARMMLTMMLVMAEIIFCIIGDEGGMTNHMVHVDHRPEKWTDTNFRTTQAGVPLLSAGCIAIVGRGLPRSLTE